MKEETDKTTPHQKKIALVGMKPIHKAAYNFLMAITFNKITKIFDTEMEAMEWLAKD